MRRRRTRAPKGRYRRRASGGARSPRYFHRRRRYSRGHPANILCPTVPLNFYSEHVTTTGVHDLISPMNGQVFHILPDVSPQPAIDSYGTTVLAFTNYDRFTTDRDVVLTHWNPYATYATNQDPVDNPNQQVVIRRSPCRATLRISSLTGSNVWVTCELWRCQSPTNNNPYAVMALAQLYAVGGTVHPTPDDARAVIGGYPTLMRANIHRVKRFWRRYSKVSFNLGHGVNKSIPFMIPGYTRSTFDYAIDVDASVNQGNAGSVNQVKQYMKGDTVLAIRVYGQLGARKLAGEATDAPSAAASSIAWRVTYKANYRGFLPTPIHTTTTINPISVGARTADGLTNVDQAWTVNNFGEGVLGQPDVVIPGQALP